jgi:hypothetical protein
MRVHASAGRVTVFRRDAAAHHAGFDRRRGARGPHWEFGARSPSPATSRAGPRRHRSPCTCCWSPTSPGRIGLRIVLSRYASQFRLLRDRWLGVG